MPQVQPLHSMKDKKTTLCGLTVSHSEHGTGEMPPMFIAPSAAEVTCVDRLECQPTTRRRETMLSRIEKWRKMTWLPELDDAMRSRGA